MLKLEAVVARSFHESVAAAADAIVQEGGWIEGHTLLSDAMAVLVFVVPAGAQAALLDRLQAAGIAARPVVPASLPPASSSPASSPPPSRPALRRDGDLRGQLTLLFSKASGDLRRTVPAFQ